MHILYCGAIKCVEISLITNIKQVVKWQSNISLRHPKIVVIESGHKICEC